MKYIIIILLTLTSYLHSTDTGQIMMLEASKRITAREIKYSNMYEIIQRRNRMSVNYVNRLNDESIIDIVRSGLNTGTGKAETSNEHILIKLMQIRNTPIETFVFDQERVDFHYNQWMNEKTN